MITIQFQVATLALHLMISLLWIIPKKTRSYEVRFFGYLLCFSTLVVVSNLIYTMGSAGLISLGISALKIIAKLDYITVIVAMFVGFMYVISKVLSENKHKSILFPAATIPLFEALMIFITEIEASNEQVLAPRGSSANVTYVFALINILAIIVMLVIFRKKFTKWHKYVFISISIVLLIGTVVQYFIDYNGILELSIINSICIAFIGIENPYNKIDIKYDCFKSNYIIPCLERYYNNNIDGFAAFIGVQCDFSNDESEEDLVLLRRHLIKELKTVPEVETFISAERDIFVLCDNPVLFEDFTKDLNEVVIEAKESLKTESNIKTTIVFVENVHITDDAKLLYRYLSSEKAYQLEGFGRHSEYYLDEQTIGKVENEAKTREIIIDALNNDRFEVFFQPIYSPKEERFSSAEALARIKKEDGTIILPRVFIKVAETTGLIMQIGDKIFEKVCQMLVDPSSRDLQLKTIDINLSPTQCENPNLAKNFIKIANKYHINPSSVNFEVTEANFEGIYKNLSKNLVKMHEYGFKLSLDDFGTGETDLNYLINVPISSVKIDRHVIWDYFDSIKTKTTVKQLIKLCHELHLDVTATGIEKISQLNEIAGQGVDFIQGYYFFKPMPLEEYISFLRPSAFEVDETKKKILKSNVINNKIN